jgi:hypothetical protein
LKELFWRDGNTDCGVKRWHKKLWKGFFKEIIFCGGFQGGVLCVFSVSSSFKIVNWICQIATY